MRHDERLHEHSGGPRTRVWLSRYNKEGFVLPLMCRKADAPMEDEENMSQEKGSLADLQNFRDQ
jgi:hypothetical protein